MGSKPAAMSVTNAGSVYGPEASYTVTGGSPDEGWTAIWRMGTRMSGWITPATCRFDEAGKGPVVTAGSLGAADRACAVWSIWFIKAS